MAPFRVGVNINYRGPMSNKDEASQADCNQQLANEVRDLREGLEMVEEKARFELGMIKSDEVFVPVSALKVTPAASAGKR